MWNTPETLGFLVVAGGLLIGWLALDSKWRSKR